MVSPRRSVLRMSMLDPRFVAPSAAYLREEEKGQSAGDRSVTSLIAPHDQMWCLERRVEARAAKLAVKRKMQEGQKEMATKAHLGKDDSAFAFDVEGMVFWEE